VLAQVAAPQEMLEEWMYRDNRAPMSTASTSADSAKEAVRRGADDLDPFGVVRFRVNIIL